MNKRTYSLENKGWINGNPPFFFVVTNNGLIDFTSLWSTPIERVLIVQNISINHHKRPQKPNIQP
jgi:hypothetical protein